MKVVTSFNQLLGTNAPLSRVGIQNANRLFDFVRRRTRGSSYLQSVRVDRKTGRLEVEFNDGAVYQYDCGPNAGTVMKNILAAPSRGSYFYHHVRMNYPYYQIRPRDKITGRRPTKSIMEKIYDRLGW